MPHNWESELQFISGLLRPEWNCIQAGANLGVFPIAFAKQTHSVLCAEPQLDTFEVLLDNIRLNECTNITAFQGAFGRESGSILCPQVPIGTTGVGLGPRCNGAIGYSVPLVRIDDVAAAVPIHFIQLDVEGMEIEALEGATRTIARDRPLLYIENNQPGDLQVFAELYGYEVAESAPNNNVVLRPCPA